jgi:hypothetical protein
MRHLDKARGALLAGLCMFGVPLVALADDPSSTMPPRETQGSANEPRGEAPQAQEPTKQEGKATEGKKKALGAGVGEQTACGEKGFAIGPLETGAGGEKGAEKGLGAGVGPGEISEPSQKGAAPIPQYWLADASLFVANAANAAQTLANEQALGVQSPNVLGNQAEFLIAATERALSSLSALQANAEMTNPKAVGEIRAAMDQLVAAKGQAQQARDAAHGGTLGPNHQATIRSTYEHLQSAERDMAGVGRHYGAPGFVLASACNYRGGKALGAGVGPKPAAKAPEKGEAPKAAPEKGEAPRAPEPEKEKGAAPAEKP